MPFGIINDILQKLLRCCSWINYLNYHSLWLSKSFNVTDNGVLAVCQHHSYHGAKSFLRSWWSLSQEFPVFHRNRRFITVFTKRRPGIRVHSPINSDHNFTSYSSNLRLEHRSNLSPSGFQTKILYALRTSQVPLLSIVYSTSSTQ
jgi:hypothetical protein